MAEPLGEDGYITMAALALAMAAISPMALAAYTVGLLAGGGFVLRLLLYFGVLR
jgi:hypothetical protein